MPDLPPLRTAHPRPTVRLAAEAMVADVPVKAEGCGAEAVYLCAKPPYNEMADRFQPIMDGAIEGAAAAEARLIYADSLYAYGPVSGPLTEDLPYAATGRKGKARAPDFYGPGVLESAVGERVFGFALAGKAASVTGNPDTRHTYMDT